VTRATNDADDRGATEDGTLASVVHPFEVRAAMRRGDDREDVPTIVSDITVAATRIASNRARRVEWAKARAGMGTVRSSGGW
jgi:hypothetical protein